MIYIERTIKIKKEQAQIEEPIILYQGDKNIELQFAIENNPFKYKSGIDATYGQLVIKRPNTAPIYSELAKLSSSKVLFTVTDDMIDELVELGDYDFQIRLISSDQTSRGTLPPIVGGIIIKPPICDEPNVNVAHINRSVALTNNESINTFDSNGNYIKTNWYNGDLISDIRLNKVENALYEINNNITTNYATEVYVDRTIDNNSRYIRDYIDDNYASKAYVDQTIEDINVDLTGYATEEYVDDSAKSTRDYVINSLTNYATTSYVDNGLHEAETYTDNAIARIDFSNYATTSYVDDQRRATEAYAEVYTKNAINKLDLSSYATESFVTDSINSNNNYIETVILKDYVTDQELEDAINGIEGGGGNVDLTGYATEQYVNDAIANNKPNLEGFATEQYVIDYTSDALGKYATKSYVDKAVANIEGGGTGGGLNIMTIGNGIDEYIFTGNEFTYEEYTSYAGKSVLLDNVTINFVDAEYGKQRTITYKNELVYVSFDGNKLFTIVSSLSERESERSQYSIGKDGTITRTYYTQYVTKEYIEGSNFATKQDIGDALGKYATKDYVNEQIGDINAILDAINGEEV